MRSHSELLECFSRVATDPDHHGQMGRRPSPGDLLVLGATVSPRVRVVLEVRPGSKGETVVFLDPTSEKGNRTFLAKHVVTLPWPMHGGGEMLGLGAK
jgi:hypothetical protein